MKKILGVLCALLLFSAGILMLELPTKATSALNDAFSEKYGEDLLARYGCGLCHPEGSFTELNSYGEDLADAIASTGSCYEFFPPNTHTESFGRCEYLHAEGYKTPYSSKCTYCHGSTLEGLIAPSCYLCHGERWTEEKPGPDKGATGDDHVQADDDAFTAIEKLDSDGDGFDNITEINAVTNPGDAGSFPGGVPEIDVTMTSKWEKDWYGARKNLVVTITPKGSTTVDITKYVELKVDNRSLYSTRLKEKSGKVEATFPQALLYTLFKSLDISDARVTVVAVTEEGEDVMKDVDIKLAGAAPDFVENVSVSFSPKTWKEDEDVEVTIKGDKAGLINEGKGFTAVGAFKKVKIKDVEREGNTLTATIEADDALDMIGNPVEGVPYTISLLGKSNDKDKAVAIFAQVMGEAGDGCFDFKPPGSHTIGFTVGECTYMHAPGYDKPADNCATCHGKNLDDDFAVSCFHCHDKLWASPVVKMKAFGKESDHE